VIVLKLIQSAGILVYRYNKNNIEVLICKAGGPFYTKNNRCWGIPKGEKEQIDKDLSETALREFTEETNIQIDKELSLLGTFRVTKVKEATIFVVEYSDLDISNFKSNVFSVEYPKGSKNIREYPENDMIAWINIEEAKDMIFVGQIQILEELEEKLKR